MFLNLRDISHRLSSSAVSPRVIQAPARSTTLKETQTYTLTCQSYGFPATQITWLHNGVQLNSSLFSSSSAASPDTLNQPPSTLGTLTVRGVNFTERGVYTCRSFSNRTSFMHGDSLSQTNNSNASLVVQGMLKPSVSYF